MTRDGHERTPKSGRQTKSAGLFTGWEGRTRLWGARDGGADSDGNRAHRSGIGRYGAAGCTNRRARAHTCVRDVTFGRLGKIRRRRATLSEPFPAEWEAALQRDVVFFRALDPPAQQRFRRQLQVFLGETRITGVKVQLDTTTRVLAATSAIIPIFGFPDWEWDQIEEVLIYPNRFDREFQFGTKQGHDILGMVGTGGLSRLMILSKPDLITGFRNATDKRNVGVHEFAHLVDKSDGVIDGVPGVGLDRQAVSPWIELMRRKMMEIEEGRSDINAYALTNEAEFFAVTAEYFFERPGVMQKKHPELYTALERVFNQSLRTRVASFRRELKRGPGQVRSEFALPMRQWP